MMIVEAVESAPTEHAVYFLVTAYIESVRHFEQGCGVPQRAITLPVAGFSDLTERLDILRSESVAPGSAVAAAEAAAVLAAALRRLSTLSKAPENELAATAMRHARTDNRRSSLSV